MATRTYHKWWGGVQRGMALTPSDRKRGEVLWSMNFGPGGVKRGGYRILKPVTNQSSNGTNPVLGMFELPYSGGSYPGPTVVIYGADEQSTGLGYLYYLKNRDVTLGINISSYAYSYDTGADAKYQFSLLGGKVYFINKYCIPLVFDPDMYDWSGSYAVGARLPVQAVAPNTGIYGSSALHSCYLQLPVPKVLGSYKNRLIIGNFPANAGPYSVSYPVGGTVTVDKDGPLTVLLSEAITDLYPDVTFQVKESFTFAAPGQHLVAQRQFLDKNLFWTEKSMWQLVGDSVDEYNGIMIDGEAGCVAPQTIVEVPGIGLVWMSKEGFWRYDGASVRPLNQGFKRLLTEHYNTFNVTPFLIDRNKLWDAYAIRIPWAGEVEFGIPLGNSDGNVIQLVYNYETDGWYLRGKSVYNNLGSGYNEKGIEARHAIIRNTSEGLEQKIFGTNDGWLCEETTNTKDWYYEIMSDNTNTKSVLAFTLATYPHLTGMTTDYFKGATITILDDRMQAERNAGTFPDGRIPSGTTRECTASALGVVDFAASLTLTLDEDLPYTPQVQVQISIHWPIRARIVDEFFTEDAETTKKLHAIRPRCVGTNSNTLSVRYEGDPERVIIDQPIREMSATRTLTLSGNDTTSKDFRINCSGAGMNGRKFVIQFEECSDSGFTLEGADIEHSTEGYS